MSRQTVNGGPLDEPLKMLLFIQPIFWFLDLPPYSMFDAQPAVESGANVFSETVTQMAELTLPLLLILIGVAVIVGLLDLITDYRKIQARKRRRERNKPVNKLKREYVDNPEMTTIELEEKMEPAVKKQWFDD